MKKKTRTITNLALAGTTVSSIALALHFYSFKDDLERVRESHRKLSEKYTEVLLENEDLHEANTRLQGEVKRVSSLLEQSAMEIDRLNKETDELQKEMQAYQKKVAELEKKFKSTP
jgi:predicted nuclease with TOPRIM domain